MKNADWTKKRPLLYTYAITKKCFPWIYITALTVVTIYFFIKTYKFL